MKLDEIIQPNIIDRKLNNRFDYGSNMLDNDELRLHEVLGKPSWWDEPSDNAFARGMTKGQIQMDWLKRHEVENENGKYVFWHGTPKTSVNGIVQSGGLKAGSYLATDQETAISMSARSPIGNRGLEDNDIHLVKLLLHPWEFRIGHWATLTVTKQIS